MIRHYEENEAIENVETDFDKIENIQFEGMEVRIFDERDKPEGSITFEAIQYVYGELEDYELIGLYRDSKGKLERLYLSK